MTVCCRLRNMHENLAADGLVVGILTWCIVKPSASRTTPFDFQVFPANAVRSRTERVPVLTVGIGGDDQVFNVAIPPARGEVAPMLIPESNDEPARRKLVLVMMMVVVEEMWGAALPGTSLIIIL